MTHTKTLWDKQKEDLAFAISNPKSLNLSEAGTGKTGTVSVLIYYWVQHLNQKVVWSQPKSLLGKNKKELLLFTDFEDEDVEILLKDHVVATAGQQRSLRKVLSGEHARIAKTLLPYKKYWPRLAKGEVIDLIEESSAKVFLVGFRFMARFWQRMLKSHPEIKGLAVDELHMAYGSNTSQNTASFYGMMRYCTHFVGMTGTLLNGRLDSVFPAIHVIEPRYYGSYGGFRHQHVGFEDEYGTVLTWKNEEKVGQILLRHSVRRTFQEMYGEEPVEFQLDVVTMNDKMRESYDEFDELAILELDNYMLDGTLPGVATIRARQIMAHPETMGLCVGEETGKDERLEMHVNDAVVNGSSLLIFSVHVAEQERIVKKLKSMGRKVALMNGNTSTEERIRIDEAFQARLIDDVVGSPQTMAVGWNWEHVDHVIYCSLTYQDVDFLQAYRRASRGNRTTVLRVSIMVYEDSADKRVLDVVKHKSQLANKVDETRPILSFR